MYDAPGWGAGFPCVPDAGMEEEVHGCEDGEPSMIRFPVLKLPDGDELISTEQMGEEGSGFVISNVPGNFPGILCRSGRTYIGGYNSSFDR
jgi:hypothetical protein